MLKWTASAQKLLQETPQSSLTRALNTAGRTPGLLTHKRHKRRATIANKENIPILTSTPMVARTRNSPLVMAPLADILNVTPEAKSNETPIRRRQSVNIYAETSAAPAPPVNRRHSSVGFVVPQIPGYAATLPKYEEEYSPTTILPSGQQLALRGLLPDAFMDNPRYFTTPEVELEQKAVKGEPLLTNKRKLEQEFMAIAQEEEEGFKTNEVNHTVLTSNKMGDQTLDKLIDAILDSARKDEKKKKPRKSFNLRRRTLIKNQVVHEQDITLSPSYAAGDDPCSDVSFLNCETLNKKQFRAETPQPGSPVPATPLPSTPLMEGNFNYSDLLQLPTPMPARQQQDSFSLATPIQMQHKRHSLLRLPTIPMPAAAQTDSFSLATPPVQSKLKRRSLTKIKDTPAAKKYKQEEADYFEIGVALPSIYV